MYTNYMIKDTHTTNTCVILSIYRQAGSGRKKQSLWCMHVLDPYQQVNYNKPCLFSRMDPHARADILPARQASGCINKRTTHIVEYTYIGSPHSPARFILLGRRLYRYLEMWRSTILILYSLTVLSYFVQAKLVRTSACVRSQVATLR